jgi:hypothetical protein
VNNLRIVATLAVLSVAAAVIGCGRPAQIARDEKPQVSAPEQTARSEDEQLLDQMTLCWLNVAQAHYDSGNTDLSFMQSQLQRVEDARQSLRALEQERRRFLAAGETLYLNNQFDPFAFNHALQMIENARQDILASFAE